MHAISCELHCEAGVAEDETHDMVVKNGQSIFAKGLILRPLLNVGNDIILAAFAPGEKLSRPELKARLEHAI